MSYIKQKYQPLEVHRIGHVMDKFMRHFERRSDESILDYNTRFDAELWQVEQATGPMNATWVAHLYLEKMKLRDDKVSQVLSGAHGRFDVDALRCSALLAFPSAGTLRAASAGGAGGGGGSDRKPPWKTKIPSPDQVA